MANSGERRRPDAATAIEQLERQAHGQDGPLRTDARPNVFYVRDVQNVLWAVDVVWGGAGWEIGASPLDDRRLWDAPVNVIAR